MNESLPFAKLLTLLNRHAVKFLVCGGVAVGFCGYPRTTENIDILVSVTDENIARLARSLAEFGDGLGSDLTETDLVLEPGCVRLNERDLPVDIFTLMDGSTYEELVESAGIVTVSGIGTVRHLSMEQLIQAKQNSFRAKDRIDVDELRRLKAKT